VVDLHNALRRKVAKGLETRGAGGGQLPKATDMFEVVWDQELANSAQRYNTSHLLNSYCYNQLRELFLSL